MSNPVVHSLGDAYTKKMFATDISLGEPTPLSQEARSVQAPLATQRSLMEVLEQELTSMESKELSKLRLYKVALVILTVIGLAIFFAFPVSLFFGVPLWIPVVISLSSALLLSTASHKLRSRCKQIQQRYRSLQIYHTHLSKHKLGVGDSALSKYAITIENNKKTRLLNQLRAKDSQNGDGGRALSQHLDLAGDFVLKYQCEALFGIDPVDDHVWQQCMTSVNQAKAGLFSGNPASAALKEASKQALSSSGVDVASLLPEDGIMEVAESLTRLCAYGRRVALEAQAAIEAYNTSFLNSPSFAAWGQELSPATQLYLKQGKATLDTSIGMLDKLQIALRNVHAAGWLSLFEQWGEQVLAFHGNSEEELHKRFASIEKMAHKLCIHDGATPENQQLIRTLCVQVKHGIYQRCLDRLREDLSSVNTKDIYSGLIEQKKAYFKQDLMAISAAIRASLGAQEPGLSVVANAEKQLAHCLLSFGEPGIVSDNIRLALQLGRHARVDIENVISKKPESLHIQLRTSIEQSLASLNTDTWGATSDKDVACILDRKTHLTESLLSAKQRLADWQQRFLFFQQNKLSSVLLEDFIKGNAYIEETKSKVDVSNIHGYLERMKGMLESLFSKSKSESLVVVPSREEIDSWQKEYQGFLREIQEISKDIQKTTRKVNNEGMSNAELFKQALLNRKSTLEEKTAAKKKELQAAALEIRKAHAEALQETQLSEISICVEQLETILSAAKHVEAFQQTQDIQAQSARKAIEPLLQAISGLSPDKLENLQQQCAAYGVQELNPQGAAVSSHGKAVEEAVDALVHAQKKCIDAFSIKKLSLKKLLTQLQKGLTKTRIAQAIVIGLVSLAFSLLGLTMLATQISWLPIVGCALSLLLQLAPWLMSRYVEKKEQRLDETSLADKMLSSTQLPASDFGNQDMGRLQQLQQVLDLEGGERLGACLIMKDVRGAPTVKSEKTEFERTIAELKKDAKVLNKKWQKMRPNAESISVGTPSVSHLKKTLQAASRAEDQLVAEIASIEAQEDVIANARLNYIGEVSRFDREQAHLAHLKQSVQEQSASVEGLQKEVHVHQHMISVLQELVKHPLFEDGELANAKNFVEKLLAQMQKVSLEGDTRSLYPILNECAEQGFLEEVLRTLELESCVGNVEQQRRQEQTRIFYAADYQKGAAQKEASINAYEELLKYLGLESLLPFVRFSCEDKPSGAVAKMQALLASLQDMQQKLQKGQRPSSQEYRKVAQFLAEYQQIQAPLYPLACCLKENFEGAACGSLMKELGKVTKIVHANFTNEHKVLCKELLCVADKWRDELVAEGNNQNLIAALKESCQGSSPAVSKELKEKLQQLPQPVLSFMIKECNITILLAVQKLQAYQDRVKRVQIVQDMVNQKAVLFENNRQAWEEENQKLSSLMTELQTKKAILQKSLQELLDRD